MLTASEAESASSDVDAPNSRESGRQAKTWSFRVFVRLEDCQTFSNLLDIMRTQQMETSLASASVISWACVHPSPLAFQDLNGMYLEGFVHALTLIRLGSLQRVLPEGISGFTWTYLHVLNFSVRILCLGEPYASVLRVFVKVNEDTEWFASSFTNHKRLSDFYQNL